MSKPAADAVPSGSTRARILQAAMLRFATHSYEATGLRDIAADVGVNVAYVHRCFGSKERLFREALEATLWPDRLFAGPARGLAASLAREVLREREGGEIRAFDIVIHSFSSPEAARVMADLLAEAFVAPLMERRDGLSATQATLVAALLAGVGILRDVVGAAPLRQVRAGELELALAGIIETIMDEAGAKGSASKGAAD